MMKYKIGDKVKIISNLENRRYELKNGMSVTVIDADGLKNKVATITGFYLDHPDIFYVNGIIGVDMLVDPIVIPYVGIAKLLEERKENEV